MPDGQRLEVGDVLDDKYVIESLLGRGGMGAVYRARHLSLNSPRSIKVMRPELAQDDAFIRRFRNEALLAEGLRHPNVVALYDFSTLPNGTLYIVWEYVEGHTIAQLIGRGVAFSRTEVIHIVAQVADGLATAHDKGILHRDVSPDNIMICTDAEGARTAKLLDFGLAKGIGFAGLTPADTDTLFGKVGYASPEQMGLLENHEQFDARTDIFSLAAVTFTMLTGESPFHSTSLQTFLHDLMIAPEAEVRQRFLERLDEPWREPLARALARDRDARPSSMKEFVGELKKPSTEAFLQRSATQGSEPMSRTSKRTLYASVAVALAAAVLVWLVSNKPTMMDTVGAPVALVTEETTEKGVSPTKGSAGEDRESPDPSDDASNGLEPSSDGPPEENSAGDRINGPGEDKPEEIAGQSAEKDPDQTEENQVGIKVNPPGEEPPFGPVIEVKKEDEDAGENQKGSSSGDAPESEASSDDGRTESAQDPLPPPTESPRESSSPIEPPRIKKEVKPIYPDLAKRREIQGIVVLEVRITPAGDVVDPVVVQSVDDLLDKAAIEAVLQWTYFPAMKGGVAVPYDIAVPIRFEMTQ